VRPLTELAATAKANLDPAHWDFFAGGAGAELSVRANESSFARRRVVPRVLRGVGDRDLRTTLLGTGLSMPLLFSPTAFHRLAHPSEVQVEPRPRRVRRHQRRRLAHHAVELGQRLARLAEVAQHAAKERSRAE